MTDDRATTTSAPPAAARRRFALLVGGAAFVGYARSLAFGFVYDDTTVIRSNPQIQSWTAVLHAAAQPYWGADGAASGLYRPVFVTAIGALWNATNHAPFWFHLFAVALHVAAAIGVWRLASRATTRWPAAIGALWFAVQPVHVEAIASVANTSEVLVALFAIALAARLGDALDDARIDARPMGWAGAAGAATIFGAACLTKESGVMLPALAVVYGLLWRRPPAGLSRAALAAAARRWQRALILCGAVLVLVVALRIAVLGALVPATIAAPGLIGLGAGARAWSMLSLGPTALRVLLVPGSLNPHYGPSYVAGAGMPTTAAIATIVVLAAAVAAAIVVLRRGDGRLAAGIAWLLLAFVPASNLFSATGQIFAERTLYVPTIGSALIVAWAADRLAARSTSRLVAVGAVSAAVLLLAARRTIAAVGVWRSHPALFAQMIAADSASYRGYWLIALDERSRRQSDSALVNLARAYRLFPDDRQLLIDYAETLRAANAHREASAIAAGLMRWPDLRRDADAVTLYLGELARGFGADSVRAASARLLARTPSPAAARFLGDADLALGDSAGARAAFRRGLALAPRDETLARRLDQLR